MRKLVSIFLCAFLITGVGVVLADVQIDEGQSKSTAPIKWFTARYARDAAFPSVISSGKVVVWDSTSNDGVTVNTTTTSYDGLAIGITIDTIPASSRDNSAANDEGYNNWGRVQVWGRAAAVSFDSGATTCVAGSKVGAHSAAGESTLFALSALSDDITVAARHMPNLSRDYIGVTLEACAAGNKDIDVFVNRG